MCRSLRKSPPRKANDHFRRRERAERTTPSLPERGAAGLDSQWVIENHGVAPDIEVDNRPDLVMKGQDPQLEKAIDLVMKKIQAHPKKLPPRPPDLPAYPPGPGM